MFPISFNVFLFLQTFSVLFSWLVLYSYLFTLCSNSILIYRTFTRIICGLCPVICQWKGMIFVMVGAVQEKAFLVVASTLWKPLSKKTHQSPSVAIFLLHTKALLFCFVWHSLSNLFFLPILALVLIDAVF